MIIEGIKKLQNGSDVRGIAMEGIEGESITLTQNMVMKITYSFSQWLKNKLGTEKLTLAIGRDSRITGEYLVQAACVACVTDGNHVFDCELATTPAMFMTTVSEHLQCDGAIMITASHLPFNRNGMKFFTKDGGLNKEDIAEILDMAETIETNFKMGGRREVYAFIPEYAQNIVQIVRTATGQEKPLDGAKIVVDAGNGAGGFFPKLVLQALGADTKGSQFLEPDGHFPNHVPNPEDQKAIKSIQEAVLNNKADMGIIFDTDVDRAAIIDEKGDAINRNRFIAFIASIILEQYPGTSIVTDSVTSTGLTSFIEKKGGKHHRFKRGYRNVINEAIRLNNAGIETHLAMETSGHGAIKENYFLDDGAYLVTMALIQYAKLHPTGKKISDFLTTLKEPKESLEKRFTIDAEDFKAYGETVLKAFENFAQEQIGWTLAEPNYEGVRVNCNQDSGDGWILMRLSLHDPVIPLNIESDKEEGCNQMYAVVETFLKQYSKINA